MVPKVCHLGHCHAEVILNLDPTQIIGQVCYLSGLKENMLLRRLWILPYRSNLEYLGNSIQVNRTEYLKCRDSSRFQSILILSMFPVQIINILSPRMIFHLREGINLSLILQYKCKDCYLGLVSW